VTKRLGVQTVLDRIDFRIEAGERVGLIGQNGSGKTTLLRLLVGECEPDSGSVERMRGVRVAYLPQTPVLDALGNVYEAALSANKELLDLEKRLESMTTELDNAEPSLIHEFDLLQEMFSQKGGFIFRSKTTQVLAGLGFSEADFQLPIYALSGGQRTRLLLAIILLSEADLYLMDEPENHLDLEAREWLENFITSSEKAFVIVSHDRRMLNHAVTRIVEVDNSGLKSFSGSFDAYQDWKRLVVEQQQKAFEAQQEFLRKTEKWIDRFRYKNTKARQVQSRIRQLEKLERIAPPTKKSEPLKLQFRGTSRNSSPALRAQGLAMGYGDRWLYKDFSIELSRRERIGVVGPNGCGKTTLLKHLAKRIQPSEKLCQGTVEWGHNVRAGFYEQLHDTLNPENTILAEIRSFRPDMTPEQVRTFMGCFGFSGEDIFKTISVISGGERSRVAIAKLVAGDANLLFLDEPTNHLDIQTREILEQALQTYEGALIFVSHDRELLDKLADRIIAFEPEGVHVIWGNYSDYRQWKQKNKDNRTVKDASAEERTRKIQKRNIERLQSKTAQAEAKKRRKRAEQVELEITQLENQINELESQFGTLPPEDYAKAASMKTLYHELKQTVENLYHEWHTLLEDLHE